MTSRRIRSHFIAPTCLLAVVCLATPSPLVAKGRAERGPQAGPPARFEVTAVSIAYDGYWAQISQGAPQARSNLTAVHDATRNRILAFGGWDDFHLYNDVWALTLDSPMLGPN